MALAVLLFLFVTEKDVKMQKMGSTSKWPNPHCDKLGSGPSVKLFKLKNYLGRGVGAGGKRSNKTDPVIIEGHRMIHNKQERLATCFVLLNVVWFWLFLRNGWLGERGCSFFSMEMLM